MGTITIDFGKHDGETLQRVPVGYLRWAVTNQIDRRLQTDEGRVQFHVLAERELKRRGERTDTIEISAHALDRISTRFLEEYIKTRKEIMPGKREGIYTWSERLAAEAVEIARQRGQDEGVVRITHEEIRWVFDFSMALPVLKTVIFP